MMLRSARTDPEEIARRHREERHRGYYRWDPSRRKESADYLFDHGATSELAQHFHYDLHGQQATQSPESRQ
jgi:hypothetical protein